MISSKLSSDILEQQFGPTKVNVLRQDDSIRVIQTVTVASGRVLEFSLVRFLPEGTKAFPDIHQAIVAGESMGKAFRAAGIDFLRNEQFACQTEVPSSIHHVFGSNQPVIVTSVLVLVGADKTPYASITELFTGDISWPNLYGRPTVQARNDIHALAQLV